MADNTSSSNGEIKSFTFVGGGGINNTGVGDTNIGVAQQNLSTMKSGSGEMDMEGSAAGDKAGDYVRELLQEKQSLDSSQWPNALRLLDQEVTKEVARIQATGKPLPKESKYVDIYREKPIRVAVKVLVPIKEHPKFNFVGKLLGPKGNSMKRLQEDTMTKMAVLGRGSMKDKQKEEELRASLDPKYAHLSDDLHVEIAAFAPPAEAHARIAYALAEVRKYLIPDSNDEIRQEQMREMEMIQTVTGDSGAAGSNNGTSSSGLRKPARGGLRGRGGIALRGAAGIRGGIPPLRGGGRGLLTTPAGVMPPRGGPAGVRKPLPPPQALLPRPTPTKTKVLSILDRARVAMEESYGCEEEMGGGAGAGGFYDSSAYDSYNATGYGSYDDYDEGAGDYYDTTDTGYPDETGNRWKGFKAPAASVVATDRSRFRPAPYTRPTK